MQDSSGLLDSVGTTSDIAASGSVAADSLGGIGEILQVVGSVIRPVYYVYFVLAQGASVLKSFIRVRDEKGNINPTLRKHVTDTQKIDTGIKIAVVTLLVLFATLSIAFPPLFYTFATVTYALTFVHEIKNLLKAHGKLKAYQEKVSELTSQLESFPEGHQDRKQIESKIEKYHAVMTIGKYKQIQDGLNVAVAAVSIIGAIIILTTGPIGLGVMAAGLVICFAIKLGVYLHQRKHVDQHTKQLARELRKEDNGEELAKTFDNYLYKKFKGEKRNEENAEIASESRQTSINSSKVRSSNYSPRLFDIKEPEPVRKDVISDKVLSMKEPEPVRGSLISG